MRRLPLALIAGAALGLLTAQANAATAYDANLAEPPGVYFGTGNSNGHFTVETGTIGGANIEIGLRAGLRFIGPVTPDGGNTNSYTVGTGTSTSPGACASGCATWNFEFSILSSSLVSAIPVVTLSVADSTGMPGHSVFFDPRLIPDNAHYNGVGGDGIQNSENLQFFTGLPLNMIFDRDQPETFTITITATDGVSSVSDTIIINQVPEPATLALLGLGLAGLGAARRRR